MLSQKSLAERVLARDSGRCVICGKLTSRISEIMDWRLWELNERPIGNLVTLCDQHAIDSAAMEIELEQLRLAADIDAELPPQLYLMQRYDRWGNPILKDGKRARGELFYEPDVYSSLKNLGLLRTFSDWVKYPRTFLLPWSGSSDDGERTLSSMEPFSGSRVIVTEKMDGENVTLYRDYIHIRGVATHEHFTRAWINEFWQRLRVKIPKGWRICGEYLYATHTVAYEKLPSYFLGFSVWDDTNTCLAWDATSEFLRSLGIITVPTLYDGPYDKESVHSAWEQAKREQSEGYVLRVAGPIEYRDFRKAVGKFVRPGYSQSDPIQENIRLGDPINTNSLG